MGGELGMGVSFYLRDNFTRNAQNIQREFGKLEGSTDTFSQKINRSMDGMQLGGTLIGIGGLLIAPFAAATQKAAEFEKQMSGVKSVMSPEEAKKYSKELEILALQMGEKTKFSAIDAAKGMEELVKAGLSATDVINGGLKPALDLAVAGDLDLASAAEIASTAVNAFGKNNVSIEQSANILAGAANASATSVGELKYALSSSAAVASMVGLTFEDTAVALAVLAQNGIKGSDAGTSLKSMLNNLQPASKQQLQVFKELGLVTASGANSFYDSAGNIKSMNDIAMILNGSMKNLTAQQRQQKIETMFGADAMRAASILFKEGGKNAQTGATGIQTMKKAMLESGITAESVAKEKMNNLKGKIEELSGAFETLLIRTGQTQIGMAGYFVEGLQVLVFSLTYLIQTPVGYFLMNILILTGLLAIGFGTFILVVNLSTFASTQLALSFAATGQTAISLAFAQKGLIGGFRALAVAAYQAMVTLLPYIAVGALIAGAIYFVYLSFQKFENVLKGTEKQASGMIGFMQKLGGVLWGISQIFSSWDGKKFNLGGAEESLKKLGILEFILNLGTYMVRMIEFVKAFGSGFASVFIYIGNVLLSVYNYIIASINSFANSLGFQGSMIGKLTSDIQNWVYWGKILGVIVGVVLVSAFAIFAISVIAATWPILAIIAAIAAIIYAIYNWGNIMDWITKTINSGFNYIRTGLDYLYKNWYSILQNIIGAVGSFSTYVLNKISEFLIWASFNVPKMLGSAFGYALSFITALVTKFIPWIITQFIYFQFWILSSIPKVLFGAFSIALELIKWIFLVAIPTWITILFNFLVWVFQNIPHFLIQAFVGAIVFIINLLTEFVKEVFSFFYDIGVGIANAILEGLQNGWDGLKSWFSDAIYSLPGSDYILGKQEKNTDISTGSTKSFGGIFGETPSSIEAENKAMPLIKTKNEQSNNTNSGTGSIFQIMLDGEQIASNVEKRQAMEKARK